MSPPPPESCPGLGVSALALVRAIRVKVFFEVIRQSFGQGGAGLELRFTRNIGIFADGRDVFTQKSENNAEVRAGLRIAF